MIVFGGIIHKQLIEMDFLEDVHAQDLEYPAQTFVDSMNLIETGNHEVNAQGDPDLGAHGVLRCAEEGLCLLNAIQTCKVEVASVNNVYAPCFKDDLVKEMNVMDGAIGNTDEYWNGSAKVDLSVEFDRSLGFAEVCPREHRKTQVYSCGIDGIDHLFKIESVGVIGIKSANFANQNLAECFIDTPIPELVGISQIGSGDVAPDAHCVALRAVMQTRFDIPQALAESDLCESHRKELVACRHPFARPGHWIAVDASSQLLGIEYVGNLRENEAACIHPLLRMNPERSGQSVQMQDMPFSSLAA